jgi:hypothetical protein
MVTNVKCHAVPRAQVNVISKDKWRETLSFLWAGSWNAHIKITINYILNPPLPKIKILFHSAPKIYKCARKLQTQHGGPRMNELTKV